jgi:hypothetical protein
VDRGSQRGILPKYVERVGAGCLIGSEGMARCDVRMLATEVAKRGGIASGGLWNGEHLGVEVFQVADEGRAVAESGGGELWTEGSS